MTDIAQFITGKIILIIIVSMLVFSVLVTFLYRPTEFEQTRFKIFFYILGSMAVTLVGLSLVISSFSFEFTQSLARATKTKELVDKLWLYPNQLLIDSQMTAHVRPQFLKSLFYNNPRLYYVSEQENAADPLRTILEEQFISGVIIQAWEDYVANRKFDVTGDVAWLSCFIQLAQSQYLKEYFAMLKSNFETSTVEFGELLFEYAARLPVPTLDPKLYKETVELLLKDERLKKIF